MPEQMSRRGFLGSVALLSRIPVASRIPAGKELPLIDYHVHLGEFDPSKQGNGRFGIVERVRNEQELKAYLSKLEGRPVFRGIEVESLDWAKRFSRELLTKVDYVLADATAFPEKLDFYLQMMAAGPLDILSNATYLPESFWTPKHVHRAVDAAVKFDVAIEINANTRLPNRAFLQAAREAGAKFSFGEIHHSDYCLEMAHALELGPEDLFVPGNRKSIDVRGYEEARRVAPSHFQPLIR